MFEKTYASLFLVLSVISVTVLWGCANNDRKVPRKVETADLYFDYRIWGDEEAGRVTVTLQFRQGDERGDAVSLVPPAEVTLDGDVLPADSSLMNGVYYELGYNVLDFEGDHDLVVTDTKGKRFTEKFSFVAMRLKNDLPDEVGRQDLVLGLTGLDTTDFIHLVMTDTGFYSRGIDRIDTVKNGKLTITRSDFDNLLNGPVFLELYMEDNRNLKEMPKGGGRLNISYRVKRAFTLRDSTGSR